MVDMFLKTAPSKVSSPRTSAVPLKDAFGFDGGASRFFYLLFGSAIPVYSAVAGDR
jgi:hypothetical protein